MPISREEFATWALEIGASRETIDSILQYEPTKENYPDYDEWLQAVCGPMKDLDMIRSMTSGDIPNVYPLQDGLLFVGTCSCGDPIAIDMIEDVDSVWYVDLPNMYRGNLRSVAVRVADNLDDFMKRFDDTMKRLEGRSRYEVPNRLPLDYHDAKRRR